MPDPHLTPSTPAHRLARLLDRHPLLAGAVACTLVSGVLLALRDHLALVNVAMLLLLVVALIAARWGSRPAILASFLNLLVFDVGFVPPRGSLTVHDAEYLIVFAVMLLVALMVSQISGHLRDSRLAAQVGERQQRLLYQLAAELNGSLRGADVENVVARFLASSYDAQVRFHAPAELGDSGHAGASVPSQAAALVDPDVRAVQISGRSLQTRADDAQRPLRLLQPLQGATRTLGILDAQMALADSRASTARAEVLAIVASLMAAALERLHYLEVAGRTQAEVESERLRNALLASLSHDLRTPLTVLYGRADVLREAAAPWPALQREAAAVCDEALRANRLCESLLDLARLRSSPEILLREWVGLEELIGAAIASLRGMCGIEHVAVDLPEDLPWLQLDAVMFERVFANLIDNALKQGGDAQRVEIDASVDSSWISISVRNSGSRFPEAPMRLLEAFVRGERIDAGAGFGVGLAICQLVVEAHGGRIELSNLTDAAEVRLLLPCPLETMQQLPDVAADFTP
jgi:two-component system, OmpR family, sensor histidine kinase KdpD